MSIVQPDYDSSPRGNTDAARHREKVKEAIRRNLPDILSDEAIITRKHDQILRVPIRGVKSYHFIHGQGGQGASGGFGSGEGDKGEKIGERPKPGGNNKPGQAGDEPGIDYLETEIDIEEIIEMMFEDLGLPNLKQKEVRETVIPKGWKHDSVEKHGIKPRLDKKRTVKEAIRRTEALVAQLMRDTGRDEAECREALSLAKGDLPGAARLLALDGPAPAGEGGAPFYIDNSDLRFRTIDEDVEYKSNAVVLAMMDTSGSMGTMKKYLARSFYFWMVSFLRTIYKHVEIRFIAHTTEAKLVDEYDFFHKGESGGTFCYAAYNLAAELIDTEYPPSSWNIYPFHFSDGEDWSPDQTVRSLRGLLQRDVSTFGYGEIQDIFSPLSTLMRVFKKGFPLKQFQMGDLTYFKTRETVSPFLGVIVSRKQDIYPALRVFLRSENAHRKTV